MASDAATSAPVNGGEESAAQQLLQKHADHHVTVEDVVDEDDLPKTTAEPVADGSWGQTMSSKAAGKRKEQPVPATTLDTTSEELFPSLGGPATKASGLAKQPIWGTGKPGVNGKSNGATPTNGTPRSATPASDAAGQRGVQVPLMKIPGRHVEEVTLEPQYVLPRDKLRRPIPDIIKDINRKSRANITQVSTGGGKLKFEAAGTPEVAQQALKDLINQIAIKTNIKVAVPHSSRAHIIGKGGSMIKALQEKTGARIQLPKPGDSPPPADEDEDYLINVIVEGNALTCESARAELMKIANERTASLNTKLKGVPVEFYPFISGRSNELEGNGVQIRVPPHQPWTGQAPPQMPAPGQRPVFQPARSDNHIQLAGDRAAVQAARTAIEQVVADLHRELELQQFSLDRGRQQFMRSMPMEDFFNDTGCAILLPVDVDDEMVTVIGPADRVKSGLDKAMDLVTDISSSTIDISRLHRNAPNGANAHAQNLTRYLRQRKELERLEKQYNSHISTQYTDGGVRPWEIISRDGKSALQARTVINNIVGSHPPARMTAVPVDPFFYQHLKKDVTPKLKESYGVHVVVPDQSEANLPVLLVFEGPIPADGPYQVPQTQPSAEDIRLFKQGLEDARKHVLDLINKQEEIVEEKTEVPQKFHERLRRFIQKEQEKLPEDQIGVRVSSSGEQVILRGPKSFVKSLAAKVHDFVEQEKEYEKERDFTMSFEFPQKFANHLIGKGGSNIKELREKFDVEIQVQDGQVELKGPKVKAEAAKAHIMTLGRTLADETTYTLKVDPKFHRELIGAQGTTINRLQTKYKVLIFFPRSAKNGKDDQSTTDAASEVGKARRQQEPDEVIIRGPKKGADEARSELLDLLQYLKDTSFTATVSVQQKQLPSLIGQGGAALDDLRATTGARVDIPTSRDSEIVEIQLKGTKDQVAAAKKILEEKRTVFNDTVIKTIEVDRKHHKALIGTGGATLRDIVVKAGGSDERRELARTIQFPKQDVDGNTIKIEGRTDVVEKIVARIHEIVTERENQVTDVVDVPVEKHIKLIGRGGQIRKDMEAQFKVTIEVPKQVENKTGVRITGRPEAVEKAKAHILSITKEAQGETVQVPRNMHHAISNGGSFFRNVKRDQQVTIDHAGQAAPPKPTSAASRTNGGSLPLITDDDSKALDSHSWLVVDNISAEEGEIPWVLRGSPEGVEKVKQMIQAAIVQAQKNSTTGYLGLPDPRTYRHVIGQSGSKVKSIRNQSGCRINVPTRGQSDDDAIEIVGSKEGVEKAKDLILAAVREGSSRDGPSGGRARE